MGLYGLEQGYLYFRRDTTRKTYMWMEDNIKTDLTEEEYGYIDYILLAQNRDQWRAVVNMAMNPRVPYKVGNFLSS
jgi:hypothetical protein